MKPAGWGGVELFRFLAALAIRSEQFLRRNLFCGATVTRSDCLGMVWGGVAHS